MVLFPGTKPNDEYLTPDQVWKSIQHFVQDFEIVYEPFYHPCSTSADVLRSMGKSVIWNDEDFWENWEERVSQCDIIITNPPFSKYKEILNKLCYGTDKPIIMLLPIAKQTTGCFRDLYKNGKKHQVIIPKSRIQFISTDDGEVSKDQKNRCSFDTAFFCWGLGLENDINYL